MTTKRMTKAQKLALAQLETITVDSGNIETPMVETIAEDSGNIETAGAEIEVPTLEEAMTAVVKTKTMKVVKTVKTGVGAQILYLIAQGELSNKEIVAKVLEDNPLRKTTYACVAWYKSQVAAGKIDLPQVEEEEVDEVTEE